MKRNRKAATINKPISLGSLLGVKPVISEELYVWLTNGVKQKQLNGKSK